jgi:mRNA-degrading endonuclease toxin of MazEF toxin-antitoxin module
VLVLGRASLLPSLSLIVVVPLSTTVRSLPLEVVLGEDDGVLAPSALKVEWIRAVDRKLLGPRFATLPERRWRAIRDGLLFVLGLDDASLRAQ